MWGLRTKLTSAVVAVVPTLCGAASVDEFFQMDVVICDASTEIQDPEIEPGGSRMVFTNKAGEVRVTTMLSTGRPADCVGTIVDTGAVIQMTGVPYANGAEWARTATGNEIVYMKAMPDGSTSMWRAWQNGGLWETAMMVQGESRGYPMPSADPNDPQYRLWYLRRLKSGQVVAAWRESEIAGSETLWPALGNPYGGTTPRWVQGQRALTTLVLDAQGHRQAGLYWIDTGQLEVLTGETTDKDEVWMWAAPEFGGEHVFIATVNGCCLKVYRQIGSAWTEINSFDAPAFAGKPLLLSPEPIVYGGRSYVAFQVGTSLASASTIWIAAIDPARPLLRRVSDSTLAVRMEPEWFITPAGPVVIYSLFTSDNRSTLRKASTGLR